MATIRQMKTHDAVVRIQQCSVPCNEYTSNKYDIRIWKKNITPYTSLDLIRWKRTQQNLQEIHCTAERWRPTWHRPIQKLSWRGPCTNSPLGRWFGFHHSNCKTKLTKIHHQTASVKNLCHCTITSHKKISLARSFQRNTVHQAVLQNTCSWDKSQEFQEQHATWSSRKQSTRFREPDDPTPGWWDQTFPGRLFPILDCLGARGDYWIDVHLVAACPKPHAGYSKTGAHNSTVPPGDKNDSFGFSTYWRTYQLNFLRSSL